MICCTIHSLHYVIWSIYHITLSSIQLYERFIIWFICSVYIYIYINILLMEYVWDPVDNGIFTNMCRICPSTILLLNHAKYPFRYSILLLLDGIIFLANSQCFSSNKARSAGRPFAAIAGSKDFTEILRKKNNITSLLWLTAVYSQPFF